jgi:hypothetical protein
LVTKLWKILKNCSMQTMIEKLFKTPPTITLAELYETQKLYFAAYAVYSYIALYQQSDEAKRKQEELLHKLYSQEMMKSSPLMKTLFSESQLKELRIIPDSMYKQFLSEMSELQTDDFEAEDVSEDPDERVEAEMKYLGIEKEISSQWEKILNEGKRLKKKVESNGKIFASTIDWDNVGLVDFIEFMIDLNRQKFDVEKLKIQELMELFLTRYKTDNNKDEDKRRENNKSLV